MWNDVNQPEQQCAHYVQHVGNRCRTWTCVVAVTVTIHCRTTTFRADHRTQQTTSRRIFGQSWIEASHWVSECEKVVIQHYNVVAYIIREQNWCGVRSRVVIYALHAHKHTRTHTQTVRGTRYRSTPILSTYVLRVALQHLQVVETLKNIH